MVLDPKTGVEIPDPVQDPNIPGQEGAAGTPAPTTPGADSKVVPISALHEEREKRQGLQAQLDAIKASLGDRVTYDATGMPVMPTTTPAAQPNVYEQIEKMWEDDPKQAVRMELQMALDWYDQVNAAVGVQEDQVRKKHPDFDSYSAEIKQYVRRLPPADRSKPGLVELAYYAIKGQKVDEIIAQKNKELLDRIQRGESIQGISSTYSTPATPASTVPTDDERKVAEAMGMKVEDYIKWRKK